ncbi:6072_t:CDS:2, partial [Gigaspora rosea]
MDTNREFPFLTRAAFDQLISEFLSSHKPSQQRKAIITQTDYDLIVSILKNPNNTSNGNANDHFWAKNNFYLCDIGISQNFIIQLMEKQNKKKSDRVICLFQNLYKVIGKIYGGTHQYYSSKKTYEAISNQYAYVSRSFVELYVARCTQCCTRKSFPVLIVEKTIASKKLLQCVQVDLVSFKKYPDKEYCLWKDIHIINGRPRHPESQGSVESSNKTLKNAISTWMEDNKKRDWSISLPIVTYAINIWCSRPTNHTPYELVFGQHPLHYFNIIEDWKKHNINIEEDFDTDDYRKLLQQSDNNSEYLEANNNGSLFYTPSNNNSMFNNANNNDSMFYNANDYDNMFYDHNNFNDMYCNRPNITSWQYDNDRESQDLDIRALQNEFSDSNSEEGTKNYHINKGASESWTM